MPEDTNTATNATEASKKEAFVPVVQFQVERNEVQWDIVQDLIKRGENKGQPYLRPASITLENFEEATKWLTSQMIVDILNAKLALAGNQITDNATDDNGKLDMEKAKAFFKDFSTRGETKADLEDKKDDLVKELTSVSTDNSMSLEARIAKITELGMAINKLTETIESKPVRTRKTKEQKAAEEAAAKAAESQAATA